MSNVKCTGTYTTLAEAFAANRNTTSGSCHIESDFQFSLLSSPHVKKVYVLKDGLGDICPTQFYDRDVGVSDGKACAQEMERTFGGRYRLAALKSECPYRHPQFLTPSASCRWTLEVQKVTPEEAAVLDVQEVKNSFETAVNTILSIFTPARERGGGL